MDIKQVRQGCGGVEGFLLFSVMAAHRLEQVDLKDLSRDTGINLWMLREGGSQLCKKKAASRVGTILALNININNYISSSFSIEKEKEEENSNERSEKTGEQALKVSEILDLYHAFLPDNPAIRVVSPELRSALKARISEDKRRANPDWWGGLFQHINECCPFLTGKVHSAGRKPFRPNLMWMVRPNNLPKILNGDYDDE